MPPVLEVEGLKKTYRGWFGKPLYAVDGVSLSIDPGTVFGLLGPNGAGKSTLVKMLLSVVRPTSGQARIFGEPVEHPRTRRRIGFLPEQMRLPDFVTARQFLRLMARLSGCPVDGPRIDGLLERVQLQRFPRMAVRNYSKGMQQRLGLAQALLHDPDLLFLDEPTEGLDPLGRKEFRDLLVELKEKGKTIFLNSHLLGEIEQVCDRIVILNRGRIIRQGTVQEFTEVRGAYRLNVSPATKAAAEKLLGAPDGEGFVVKAAGPPELNVIIDQLRAAGVEIEELRREKESLEDFFVEVVKE